MWSASHVCNANCSAFRGQTGGPACEGNKPSYMKPTKATAQRVRYQPPTRDDNFNPKRVQHRHLWVIAFFSFLGFGIFDLLRTKKACMCNDEWSAICLAVYYIFFVDSQWSLFSWQLWWYYLLNFERQPPLSFTLLYHFQRNAKHSRGYKHVLPATYRKCVGVYLRHSWRDQWDVVF